MLPHNSQKQQQWKGSTSHKRRLQRRWPPRLRLRLAWGAWGDGEPGYWATPQVLNLFALPLNLLALLLNLLALLAAGKARAHLSLPPPF